MGKLKSKRNYNAIKRDRQTNERQFPIVQFNGQFERLHPKTARYSKRKEGRLQNKFRGLSDQQIADILESYPDKFNEEQLSVLRGAGWLDDIGNWIVNAARAIGDAFAKAFDPKQNGLEKIFNDAVAVIGPALAEIGDKIKNSLDPEKNGVSDAFKRWGNDVQSAFNELGEKIKAQAAADAEKLKAAFGPVGDAFKNLGSAEWWTKTMTDPETYFMLAGFLISAAGSFLGPAGVLLANGVVGAARMITKAAKGEQINLSDVGDLVVGMIPGGGGAKAAKATTVAAQKSVMKEVGEKMAKAPVDKLARTKQIGQQLVEITKTGETMGFIPPLQARKNATTVPQPAETAEDKAKKKQFDFEEGLWAANGTDYSKWANTDNFYGTKGSSVLKIIKIDMGDKTVHHYALIKPRNPGPPDDSPPPTLEREFVGENDQVQVYNAEYKYRVGDIVTESMEDDPFTDEDAEYFKCIKTADGIPTFDDEYWEEITKAEAEAAPTPAPYTNDDEYLQKVEEYKKALAEWEAIPRITVEGRTGWAYEFYSKAGEKFFNFQYPYRGDNSKTGQTAGEFMYSPLKPIELGTGEDQYRAAPTKKFMEDLLKDIIETKKSIALERDGEKLKRQWIVVNRDDYKNRYSYQDWDPAFTIEKQTEYIIESIKNKRKWTRKDPDLKLWTNRYRKWIAFGTYSGWPQVFTPATSGPAGQWIYPVEVEVGLPLSDKAKVAFRVAGGYEDQTYTEFIPDYGSVTRGNKYMYPWESPNYKSATNSYQWEGQTIYFNEKLQPIPEKGRPPLITLFNALNDTDLADKILELRDEASQAAPLPGEEKTKTLDMEKYTDRTEKAISEERRKADLLRNDPRYKGRKDAIDNINAQLEAKLQNIKKQRDEDFNVKEWDLESYREKLVELLKEEEYKIDPQAIDYIADTVFRGLLGDKASLIKTKEEKEGIADKERRLKEAARLERQQRILNELGYERDRRIADMGNWFDIIKPKIDALPLDPETFENPIANFILNSELGISTLYKEFLDSPEITSTTTADEVKALLEKTELAQKNKELIDIAAENGVDILGWQAQITLGIGRVTAVAREFEPNEDELKETDKKEELEALDKELVEAQDFTNLIKSFRKTRDDLAKFLRYKLKMKREGDVFFPKPETVNFYKAYSKVSQEERQSAMNQGFTSQGYVNANAFEDGGDAQGFTSFEQGPKLSSVVTQASMIADMKKSEFYKKNQELIDFSAEHFAIMYIPNQAQLAVLAKTADFEALQKEAVDQSVAATQRLKEEGEKAAAELAALESAQKAANEQQLIDDEREFQNPSTQGPPPPTPDPPFWQQNETPNEKIIREYNEAIELQNEGLEYDQGAIDRYIAAAGWLLQGGGYRPRKYRKLKSNRVARY